MFDEVEKLIKARLSSIDDEVSELEADLKSVHEHVRGIQERILALGVEKEGYLSSIAVLATLGSQDTPVEVPAKKRGRPAKKKIKEPEVASFVSSEVEDSPDEEPSFEPVVEIKQAGGRRKFVPIPRTHQSYAGVKAGRPEDIGIGGKR